MLLTSPLLHAGASRTGCIRDRVLRTGGPPLFPDQYTIKAPAGQFSGQYKSVRRVLYLGMEQPLKLDHSPLGGASRAPGLPQAAAWRTCGRGPHPLRERRQMSTEGPCRGRVGPVCRFREGSRADHRMCRFKQHSHMKIQRNNASGESRFGPYGGVRF